MAGSSSAMIARLWIVLQAISFAKAKNNSIPIERIAQQQLKDLANYLKHRVLGNAEQKFVKPTPLPVVSSLGLHTQPGNLYPRPVQSKFNLQLFDPSLLTPRAREQTQEDSKILQ